MSLKSGLGYAVSKAALNMGEHGRDALNCKPRCYMS